IAAILLMLTGPVLRGSISVADLSRVIVLVDQSRSMSLTDESMSSQRKQLNARQLGWLDSDTIDTSIYDAARLLASVRPPIEGQTRQDIVRHYHRLIFAAVDALPDKDPLKKPLQKALLNPINRVRDQLADPLHDPAALDVELERIQQQAQQWHEHLEADYRQRTGQASPSDSQPDGVASRFDELTRWSRAEKILLGQSNPLLPNLANQHLVDLYSFSGDLNEAEPNRLWQPLHRDDFPESFHPHQPAGASTDLVTQLDSLISQLPKSQRLAVVMFTDGQHNLDSPNDTNDSPSSPLRLSQLLGSRGVPLFPIGMGTSKPPADLAVLSAEVPDSVFADDRIKGKLLIQDHMSVGKPLEIMIHLEGQTVWSEQLVTSGSGSRALGFDFSIQRWVKDRLGGAAGKGGAVSMALPLEFKINPVEGEARDDNNTFQTNVRAITRPRRVLVIDGRPRWEYRYLRNLLDRDNHWEVNDILARGADGRIRIPRGSRPGQFPSSRRQLFAHDVIILGDIPRQAFEDQELEWIDQFVSERGGGLLLIDGQRGKLKSFDGSILDALLPVDWYANRPPTAGGIEIGLSQRGRSTAALALAGDDNQSLVNWNRLPPVRWLANVRAAPGCEVLLSSTDPTEPQPALVMRRYGAGTVMYSAFEDSWRWRYEVADEFHQRYWNQLVTFIMESPYSIHDRLVSIDTGGLVYQPGETANLKVRLRDRRGQPVIDAKAEAILYLEEAAVAAIPLTNDGSPAGLLRATTPPLESGHYQVGVRARGYDPSELSIRAEFAVTGDAFGELNSLHCNEKLLEQMAEASGGQYLREEDVGQLIDLLAPQADGKDEVTEITLWRSWYWFVPLVGLFTVEWLLRKRMGLM
ncbi:MAG: hypothetical protein MI861_17095, partial [Pirellulales bacterium]|nr:hypothetical protein [Pirellulales bacterium]